MFGAQMALDHLQRAPVTEDLKRPWRYPGHRKTARPSVTCGGMPRHAVQPRGLVVMLGVAEDLLGALDGAGKECPDRTARSFVSSASMVRHERLRTRRT